MNDTELKTLLGLKIKHYRKQLALTQEELGEKIERTQRQVSLIELGSSFPNPEALINIAKVFNCSIKDLFDFEHLTLKRTDMINYIENKIQYLDDRNIKFIYKIIKSLF